MLKFLNKYKLITFFTLLFIISAVLSPIIKNYYLGNWSTVLEEKITEIEAQLIFEFKEKFTDFSNAKSIIQKNIVRNNSQNIDENFSWVLLNENDSLVNYAGFYADKIKYGNISKTEYDFQDELLFTFLKNSEEIFYQNKKHCIVIAELIEKKYNIENNQFIQVSFTNYLSQKYKIDLSINYSTDSLINSDGRNHYFYIFDSYNKKLATVTFAKPSRDIFVNNLNDIVNSIQSLLLLFLILTFFYEIIKDARRKIISKNFHASLYIFLILLIRFALFSLNVPAIFISGDFVSPAIYSSSFGWGIASTPLELLISSIALFFIILLFHYKLALFISNKFNKKIIPELFLLIFSILFFYLVRGFGAVLKSIIIDSSINYFNNDSLIFPFATLAVLLAALLITLTIFIILYNLIDGINILIQKRYKKSPIISIFYTLVTFQLVGFIFDLIQKEPLLSPPLRIGLITILIIIYFISKKENYKFSTVVIYLVIIAATISSILLANFNNEKDEKSIKVVAHELTRFDKDFIEANLSSFLFDELYSLINNEEDLNNNYNQFLFYLWANGSLKENVLNSSFYLYDSSKNKIGSFVFNQSENYALDFKKYFLQRNIEKPQIFDESIFSNSNTLIGVTSFSLNDEKFYLGLKVNYDLKSLITSKEPEVFLGKQKYLLTNQFINNLLILKIDQDEVTVLNKNISLDAHEISLFKKIQFNNRNDNWNEIEIDGNNYKFYSLKNNSRSQNVIAVGLQEKETPLTLFQFFKIFLIFSLFILIYGIIVLLLKYSKHRKIIVDFRTKVAFSLIIISIAPLLLLAIYFRTLTDEKNLDATFYKLNKRAVNIEEYIGKRISSIENNFLEFEKILKNASEDLGIEFNIYSKKELIFSSRSYFYNSGILPNWIDSDSYKLLFQKKQNDILLTAQIEKVKFNSLFHKIKINDQEYVIEINDLFNSVLMPLSISEFDIILFGTYSLGAIFVIILSTILANQISLPLRRLTNAAKSASYGDLNLNIQYKRQDEIGELTNAFNKMLDEIKKMQTDLSDVERESAWKEMAKQVAHEIKNPLTPMKLSMQQLIAAHEDKSPKFDEIFSKVGNTILGQIDNLKNIASEFSNFARMPIGEVLPVNLKEIITEVTSLFVDERIKINLAFPNMDFFVNADANHLKRIFINLIRNSIQANADNLFINIGYSKDVIEIKVIDNGSGIPNELVEKVFEKGFTTKQEGMGLGLNLAKRYLNNISGDIKIEKSNNEETIFLITIPAKN